MWQIPPGDFKRGHRLEACATFFLVDHNWLNQLLQSLLFPIPLKNLFKMETDLLSQSIF